MNYKQARTSLRVAQFLNCGLTLSLNFSQSNFSKDISPLLQEAPCVQFRAEVLKVIKNKNEVLPYFHCLLLVVWLVLCSGWQFNYVYPSVNLCEFFITCRCSYTWHADWWVRDTKSITSVFISVTFAFNYFKTGCPQWCRSTSCPSPFRENPLSFRGKRKIQTGEIFLIFFQNTTLLILFPSHPPARVFFQQPDEEVDKCWAALLNLNKKLTECPADRQRLLEVRMDIAFESDSLILKYSMSGPPM